MIATKTKIDLGDIKLPARLDDDYFKTKEVEFTKCPKKSKRTEDEIFDTKEKVRCSKAFSPEK